MSSKYLSACVQCTLRAVFVMHVSFEGIYLFIFIIAAVLFTFFVMLAHEKMSTLPLRNSPCR
jgi:hypothetical protein